MRDPERSTGPRPYEREAKLWLSPERVGAPSTLGVLADEAWGLLWVCAHAPASAAPSLKEEVSALRTCDLGSGVRRAVYKMPGGGSALCNDIAASPRWGVFVTDTRAGRVLRLASPDSGLALWAQGEAFAGADGVAVSEDSVFVTSVARGSLLRVPIRADGTAGDPQALETSVPLRRPDGLRNLRDGRLLLSDWELGKVFVVEVDGRRAVMRTLGGRAGTTAATVARRGCGPRTRNFRRCRRWPAAKPCRSNHTDCPRHEAS